MESSWTILLLMLTMQVDAEIVEELGVEPYVFPSMHMHAASTPRPVVPGVQVTYRGKPIPRQVSEESRVRHRLAKLRQKASPVAHVTDTTWNPDAIDVTLNPHKSRKTTTSLPNISFNDLRSESVPKSAPTPRAPRASPINLVTPIAPHYKAMFTTSADYRDWKEQKDNFFNSDKETTSTTTSTTTTSTTTTSATTTSATTTTSTSTATTSTPFPIITRAVVPSHVSSLNINQLLQRVRVPLEQKRGSEAFPNFPRRVIKRKIATVKPRQPKEMMIVTPNQEPPSTKIIPRVTAVYPTTTVTPSKTSSTSTSATKSSYPSRIALHTTASPHVVGHLPSTTRVPETVLLSLDDFDPDHLPEGYELIPLDQLTPQHEVVPWHEARRVLNVTSPPPPTSAVSSSAASTSSTSSSPASSLLTPLEESYGQPQSGLKRQAPPFVNKDESKDELPLIYYSDAAAAVDAVPEKGFNEHRFQGGFRDNELGEEDKFGEDSENVMHYGSDFSSLKSSEVSQLPRKPAAGREQQDHQHGEHHREQLWHQLKSVQEQQREAELEHKQHLELEEQGKLEQQKHVEHEQQVYHQEHNLHKHHHNENQKVVGKGHFDSYLPPNPHQHVKHLDEHDSYLPPKPQHHVEHEKHVEHHSDSYLPPKPHHYEEQHQNVGHKLHNSYPDPHVKPHHSGVHHVEAQKAAQLFTISPTPRPIITPKSTPKPLNHGGPLRAKSKPPISWASLTLFDQGDRKEVIHHGHRQVHLDHHEEGHQEHPHVEQGGHNVQHEAHHEHLPEVHHLGHEAHHLPEVHHLGHEAHHLPEVHHLGHEAHHEHLPEVHPVEPQPTKPKPIASRPKYEEPRNLDFTVVSKLPERSRTTTPTHKDNVWVTKSPFKHEKTPSTRPRPPSPSIRPPSPTMRPPFPSARPRTPSRPPLPTAWPVSPSTTRRPTYHKTVTPKSLYWPRTTPWPSSPWPSWPSSPSWSSSPSWPSSPSPRFHSTPSSLHLTTTLSPHYVTVSSHSDSNGAIVKSLPSFASTTMAPYNRYHSVMRFFDEPRPFYSSPRPIYEHSPNIRRFSLGSPKLLGTPKPFFDPAIQLTRRPIIHLPQIEQRKATSSIEDNNVGLVKKLKNYLDTVDLSHPNSTSALADMLNAVVQSAQQRELSFAQPQRTFHIAALQRRPHHKLTFGQDRLDVDENGDHGSAKSRGKAKQELMLSLFEKFLQVAKDIGDDDEELGYNRRSMDVAESNLLATNTSKSDESTTTESPTVSTTTVTSTTSSSTEANSTLTTLTRTLASLTSQVQELNETRLLEDKVEFLQAEIDNLTDEINELRSTESSERISRKTLRNLLLEVIAEAREVETLKQEVQRDLEEEFVESTTNSFTTRVTTETTTTSTRTTETTSTTTTTTTTATTTTTPTTATSTTTTTTKTTTTPTTTTTFSTTWTTPTTPRTTPSITEPTLISKSSSDTLWSTLSTWPSETTLTSDLPDWTPFFKPEPDVVTMVVGTSFPVDPRTDQRVTPAKRGLNQIPSDKGLGRNGAENGHQKLGTPGNPVPINGGLFEASEQQDGSQWRHDVDEFVDRKRKDFLEKDDRDFFDEKDDVDPKKDFRGFEDEVRRRLDTGPARSNVLAELDGKSDKHNLLKNSLASKPEHEAYVQDDLELVVYPAGQLVPEEAPKELGPRLQQALDEEQPALPNYVLATRSTPDSMRKVANRREDEEERPEGLLPTLIRSAKDDFKLVSNVLKLAGEHYFSQN